MKPSTIKIISTAAAIILVAAMLWLANGQCNQPKLVQPVDSTFYWKNEAAQLVASQKGMAQQFAYKEKRFADSLAAVYNTKAKYLQEWVLMFTETKADLAPVPGTVEMDYIDTTLWQPDNKQPCPPVIKNIRQKFHSAYYDALVQIGDSSFMQLSGLDTISVIWKIVKEGGLFNRRKMLQIDATTANPATRVAGLKAFRAGPLVPNRWGLGAQLGYEFDGKRFRPYFGIGLSYNIIRF